MFKSTKVDVFVSLALLVIALVAVDLSVVDFSLVAAATKVCQALIAIGAVLVACVILRRG